MRWKCSVWRDYGLNQQAQNFKTVFEVYVHMWNLCIGGGITAVRRIFMCKGRVLYCEISKKEYARKIVHVNCKYHTERTKITVVTHSKVFFLIVAICLHLYVHFDISCQLSAKWPNNKQMFYSVTSSKGHN